MPAHGEGERQQHMLLAPSGGRRLAGWLAGGTQYGRPHRYAELYRLHLVPAAWSGT